jgi:Tol biopolymer transport system component
MKTVSGEDSQILKRSKAFLLALIILAFGALSLAFAQKEEKKEEKKKKTEPFKVERLTQGMGLYFIGSVSPDGKSVFLIAKKPDHAPNLYVMNTADFSIRPPLTDFKWGVTDPAWSADSQSVAFAGNDEQGGFSEVYIQELKSGRLRRMTSNSFADRQPAFSPDGKRLFFTTDESPLPDAAFGILHIAAVPVAGGKSEYFTEDETSSILPAVSADGKSLLLVKVDEMSGRHSLWQYGFDGKAQRDLTERKFARIHRYIPRMDFLVLCAQEEPEQQENIYMLDLKTREIRPLPDWDSAMRTPALSPDGRLIAFISPAEEGIHLFLFDTSTGEIRQLTEKGFNNHSPVFISNDRILFGSDRDRQSEIYMVNLAAPAQDDKKKK